MLPRDITAGESWACRFTVTAMIDDKGNLYDSSGVEPGAVVAARPGEYHGVGVIVRRDVKQELLELRDTASGKHFVVEFAAVTDIDRVEWIEE
jgi:hypothetical protein